MKNKYEKSNDDGSVGDSAGDSAGGLDPAAGPTFASTLGEDIRNNPSLADFKDVDALANSYVNLKKYQGSSIRIPTDDASDEAKSEFLSKLASVNGVMASPDFTNQEQSAEFYQSLGAPKDKDGYELNLSGDNENFKYDENKVNAFRDIALKQGLSKKQFSALMEGAISMDVMSASAQAETKATEMAGLKQEWGAAYDQNLAQAISVASATDAPEAIVNAIKNGNTGPAFTKWMHSLAGKFGGEGQNLLNRQEAITHETPEEIKGRISDIMNNKEHPYWQRSHPDHSSAVNKMLGLQRRVPR